MVDFHSEENRVNGRFWETAHLPSQNLTFSPKKEVSVNVKLGEGWVGSFPKTTIDPENLRVTTLGSSFRDIQEIQSMSFKKVVSS